MARCAEAAAKNLDETYLDTHHKDLSDAYGRLTGMLKAVLAPDEAVDVQTVQEQASMQSAISREELCSDLAELSDCLKTFEADRAEEIIKKLQGLSCDGQPVSALLEDIRSDIDNFEMDAAEKKVQDLIRQKKGGEA